LNQAFNLLQAWTSSIKTKHAQPLQKIICGKNGKILITIQARHYAGFLPEFAKNAAFAGNSAVMQRPLEKGLRYDRSLVLAWLEASMRNRPFLEKMINALRVRIGRSL